MDLLAGIVSAIIPWNKITGKVLAINKISPDLLSNTDGYFPSKLMLCLKLCISVLALAILSP